MASAESKQLQVTLVKSPSGRSQKHQATVRGLGLKRMHQQVVVAATPENLGMIDKIAYMLKVEEV